MPRCAVYGCYSRSVKNDSDGKIRFYKFPEIKDIRSKWFSAAGRKEDKFKLWWRICSKHFTRDSFSGKRVRSRLKENAVPTLNLPVNLDTVLSLMRPEGVIVQYPNNISRTAQLPVQRTVHTACKPILKERTAGLGAHKPEEQSDPLSPDLPIKQEVTSLDERSTSPKVFIIEKPKRTGQLPVQNESDTGNTQTRKKTTAVLTTLRPRGQPLCVKSPTVPQETFPTVRCSSPRTLVTDQQSPPGNILRCFAGGAGVSGKLPANVRILKQSIMTPASGLTVQGRNGTAPMSANHRPPFVHLPIATNPNMVPSKPMAIDTSCMKAMYEGRIDRLQKQVANLEKIAKNRHKTQKRLSRQIVYLKKMNSELNLKVKELSKNVLHEEEMAMLNIAKKNEIIKRYIFKEQNNASRVYPIKLKRFAVILYRVSPQAYDFIRNELEDVLPHPNTVYKWSKTFELNGPFTAIVNEALNENTGNEALNGNTGNEALVENTGNEALDDNTGNEALDENTGNEALDENTGNEALYDNTGNEALDENTGNEALDDNTVHDAVYLDISNELDSETAVNEEFYENTGNEALDEDTVNNELHEDMVNDASDADSDIETINGNTVNETLHENIVVQDLDENIVVQELDENTVDQTNDEETVIISNTEDGVWFLVQ